MKILNLKHEMVRNTETYRARNARLLETRVYEEKHLQNRGVSNAK